MLVDCCGASNKEWCVWRGWCTGGRLARGTDEHAGLFSVVHCDAGFSRRRASMGLEFVTIAMPGGDACGANNGDMLELP
ncbi:Hypothetical protein NGAL_HAMBI2605_28120 [Neorhizobium galegae bv. orientalis]|nr:Hypothetical protein NGAL_HAMBI2566_12850 [Neorhizobium galegae bv. orientalis]CDZ64121.1 Hypothetical protein NGAL_HAMBI2605_28120 [Neorhizobium galegae bv. orientalis]